MLRSNARTIDGVLRTEVLLVQVGVLILPSTQDGTVGGVVVEHQAGVFVHGHLRHVVSHNA